MILVGLKTMRIAIIGVGHAGVEAAASARQAGTEVVLFWEL